MKKYLLLALATLAFPLVAGAITPKLGHYEGTAVHNNIIFRHISFDVTFSDNHYFVRHLHMPPNIFNHPHGSHFGGFWKTNRTFHFDQRDVVDIQFNGHGTWEEDGRVAGDFREHPAFSPFNTYYTWHANWKHD